VKYKSDFVKKVIGGKMSEWPRTLLTIGIILIIILVLSNVLTLFTPKPTIEVVNAKLDPETININQVATLEITIKSNDKSKSHFLRIEFESHSLVSFLIGDQYLPRDQGRWYFTDNVNPSATITQPFYVRATLESGIAQLQYQIVVNFYCDGNQFDSKTFVLTVRR
jgi:hypothetical protein